MTQFTLQQTAIICSPPTTMAVYAAPGSGKTTVLTQHIATLLQRRMIEPKEVWAMTFTRKAANELRQRVRQISGINTKAVESLRIGTFHAQIFAVLLANNPGIPRIMDPTLQARYLAASAVTEGVAPTAANLRLLQQVLAKAAVADGTVLRRKLARIVEGYRRRKMHAKLWDFDDILLEAKRLLMKYGARSLLQNHTHYLLVDEFQDTNDIQFWILKRLMEDTGGRLFVVGDDDQSIYGFRGATPRFLTEFTTSFPAAQSSELSMNFRSPEKLLQPSWQLIAVNRERRQKRFDAYRLGGNGVKLRFCSSDLTESELIVQDLQARLAQSQHQTVAVLARTRRQLFRVAKFSRTVSHHNLSISTFHEAKGREWDTVYILDAVEPNPFMPQDDRALLQTAREEERRLFYVAMTRARNSLIICVPESLCGTKVQPSGFLTEAGLIKS